MSSFLRVKAEGILGRLIAFIGLVTFLPALLATAFLLRSNSDEPVLLTDEVTCGDGSRVRIHRLRTTGRGSNAFRAIGRLLRSVGYDDVPALWDVLCGRIGLMQLYHLDRKQ